LTPAQHHAFITNTALTHPKCKAGTHAENILDTGKLKQLNDRGRHGVHEHVQQFSKRRPHPVRVHDLVAAPNLENLLKESLIPLEVAVFHQLLPPAIVLHGQLPDEKARSTLVSEGNIFVCFYEEQEVNFEFQSGQQTEWQMVHVSCEQREWLMKPKMSRDWNVTRLPTASLTHARHAS
jgi:hypothetical protein